MAVGLCQYVEPDNSMEKAMELAEAMTRVPKLSNYAICSAISHTRNMSAFDASYMEAFVAGVVNTQPAAQERLAAFADGSAARVKPQN